VSQRTILVDSPEELRALQIALVREPILAIDTEFHSEKRYHPELMLIQIANRAGDVWIVDPKKVPMPPLGQALREATLVTHGGQQDIRILYQDLHIRPKRLFDTQIAAGFLGHRYPMGLQDLCAQTIEQELSKGESLTDWSARPLTQEQIDYAAMDARVLIPLYDALLTDLEAANKDTWIWQACDEMVEHVLQPKPAGLIWTQWGVAETLDLQSQRVLTRLLEWREDTARHRNQSPNYILPRSILIFLAKKQPSTIQDIKKNRKVHPSFIKRYAKDALQVIQQGISDTEDFLIPTNEQKERSEILKLWSQIFAQEIAIAPNLMLPKEMRDAIAVNGVSIIQDWRQHLVADRLNRFLTGQECIGIQQGIPVLIPLSPV
jgi:ribonuclease D